MTFASPFTLFQLLGACASDPCNRSAAYLQNGTEFTSLSEAAMSPGDLLHVCAGVHRLSLWSPFATAEGSRAIVGEGSDSTIIEFSAGYAFGSGVDSLSVSGITFRNAGGVPSNSCPGSDVPCYDLWWCGAVNVFDGYSYVFTDVTFQANRADYGGAMCINGNDDDPARVRAPYVRLVDSKFESNVAGHAGGAVLIDGPATVISENTDWGEGDEDNAPDDIAIAQEGATEEDMEIRAAYSFDGVAFFGCDWYAKTCD